MARPFSVEEDDAEDQRQRLVLFVSECVEVLSALLERLRTQHQAPPAAPAATSVPTTNQIRSRLPSCEEEDEDEDDSDEPPSVSTRVQVDAEGAGAMRLDPLPDVVPRPAPRPSLRRPSAFTKYITGTPAPSTSSEDAASRQPVAESATTLCFTLPDLVRDVACPAPSPAPRTWPSPAPRGAVASQRAFEAYHPPETAPRRDIASLKRRPQKAQRAAVAEMSAAASKFDAPCLTPCAALRSEWLRRQEDDLEKALSKMAAVPCGAAVPVGRKDDWVRVGENLRVLADHFNQTMPSVDVVDGPAPTPSSSSGSLLSMLLPPPVKGTVKGTFLTTVVLFFGWRLFTRSR